MSTITTTRYESRKILLPQEVFPPREEKKVSFFRKVQLYIAREDAGENHFKWVGFTMAAQAFIITPVIAVIIMATGNWIPLWFVATASMFSTFIPNLAGLPVKHIMTVFFINLAVSMLIITAAVLHAITSL